MRFLFSGLLMLVLFSSRITAQDNRITEIAYSKDGTMIAVSREAFAYIEVLAVDGTQFGTTILQILPEDDEILVADWHPDYEKLLVITSDQRERQFWDVSDPKEPERVFLEQPPQMDDSQNIDPYSEVIEVSNPEVRASSNLWGNISIREIDSCVEIFYEDVGGEFILDMALRPLHTQLAVAIAYPYMIHLVDWVSGMILDIPLDGPAPDAIGWSPDGRYLAYGQFEVTILDFNAYETSFSSASPMTCDFSPLDGYALNDAIRLAREESYNGTKTICLAKDTVYEPYLTSYDDLQIGSDPWITAYINSFDGLIRLEGNGAILDLKPHGIVEITETVKVDTEGMNAWSIVNDGSLYIHNLTIRSGMNDGPGIINSGDLYLDHVIFENYGANEPYSDQILLWNDGRHEESSATVCANEVLFRNTDSSSGTAILNDGGEVTVINSVFERNSPTFGRYVIEQAGEAITDAQGNWWGTANGPMGEIEPGILFEPFALEPFEWSMDIAPAPHR